MLAAALLLALSQLPSAPRDPALQRAITLYETVELDRARRILEPLQEAPELTKDDRVLARMYLAATCHALKDEACADAALQALAELAPDARLPSERFDPALRARQDELLAAREAAKPAPPNAGEATAPPTHVEPPAPAVAPAFAAETAIAPAPDRGVEAAGLPARKLISAAVMGLAAAPLSYAGWSVFQRQQAQAFHDTASTNEARAGYQSYVERSTVQAAVGFAVGAALIGTGAVLFATGGASEADGPQASVAIAPGYAGVVVSCRFDR